MSQSAVRALRAGTAHGGGDHAGAVSPLSSSCDDLNRHIIRLLQDDGRNEHVHGQSDAAHIEVMTRIGMFNNQFLLERHVPQSVRRSQGIGKSPSLQSYLAQDASTEG